MGHKKPSAIMDPVLIEDFVRRACTDIEEGFVDSVIEVLSQMSKKTGLVCAAHLTAYLAKNNPSRLQLFLDHLEENYL